MVASMRDGLNITASVRGGECARWDGCARLYGTIPPLTLYTYKGGCMGMVLLE